MRTGGVRQAVNARPESAWQTLSEENGLQQYDAFGTGPLSPFSESRQQRLRQRRLAGDKPARRIALIRYRRH
jgi:hypothetical protein